MAFTHLRCHSSFSLLEGAATVDELLETAAGHGYGELALTDTNGLYAAPAFWKKARELGVRPIFGAELTERLERGGRGARLVVLARDRGGFAAVSRLVTARRLEDDFDLAAAVEREAGQGHVFLFTADETLLRGLAGKLPRGCLYAELCSAPESGRITRFRRLDALARGLGLGCVATANVHFAGPEGHSAHRLLRAIDLGRTVGSLREDESVDSSCLLAPEREMRRRLQGYPRALENAARLAEACRCELPTGGVIFPSCELPEGESAYSVLLKDSFRGACRRYPRMSSRVLERLRAELEVIERQGFAPYFLVVADIARHARERRIPMVGRGSAANSLVSYSLGITDVDPLRYNLFFERFLNPERDSPPDIDLDFSWRRRDEVIEYVYRTYGADRVAMICTYVTFSARLAFREAARAMGVPARDLRRFTRLLPRRILESDGPLEERWPECSSLPLDEEPWRSVLLSARRIAGFPRHLSMHAGGIVVSPFPLTDLVPLERSAKGPVVTQYDMYGVEDLGLVKIDLLSQRSLSVVEDVVRRVERNEGEAPPLEDVDRLAADPAAAALVARGRTMGCFYIESPAMRSLLARLRVRGFEELTAASSVIRPGVAESGMMAEYIERHRGRRPVSYLHPKLEELLGETYGVMVYQEDVIRVAHAIAGMSLGEADLLRRAMSGKMRSRNEMDRMRERFVEASVGRGVERSVAAEIWRQIRSFAGYAFCKAHSASYARVSFQVAWLKAHYPAQFMAAVLSNGGGFYGPSAYIEEARRMGLRIMPPDINRSGLEYRGHGRTLRVGLGVVSGIGRRTLGRIVEEREREGFYTCLDDFHSRTGASPAETRTLIRCGAFDCFELTRPELLWRLELLLERGNANGEEREEPLFVAGTETVESRRVVPRLPEYGPLRRLLLERELFGFTVSRHPLFLYREQMARIPGLTGSGALSAMACRRVRMVGRPISRKRIRTEKSGAMMFLSLDDLEGTFEVVLFPACYRRCGALALGPGPFLVHGRVDCEHGVCTVVCDRLEQLDEPEEDAARPAGLGLDRLPGGISPRTRGSSSCARG